MVRRIELLPTPSQSLEIDADGHKFTIRIFELFGGDMAADVYKDKELLIASVRLVAEQPIIPYYYLAKNVNFLIVTDNGEKPHWAKFGISQHLVVAERGAA